MREGRMFTFSHLQLSGMRSIHSTQKDFRNAIGYKTITT